MPDLLIADVNNSRRVTDWTKYAEWSPVLIAKMTEGDTFLAPSFAKHAAGAAAYGLKAFGAYHFWTPGADPIRQADNAIRALAGGLRTDPVEWLILDVETGTDFAAYERFCDHANAMLGGNTWLYGGRQLEGYAPERPLWVARYPKTKTPDPAKQPGIGETLWQFTDDWTIPGVGRGDCSVFRGSPAKFLTLLRGDIMATLDADDIKAIGAEMSRQLAAVFTGRGQTTDEASWDRLYDNSLEAALVLPHIKAAVDNLGAGDGTVDVGALAKAVADELASRLQA